MTDRPIKVVKVIDQTRVIINRGSFDEVGVNDRFLIYQHGEEIYDPDTNESLGRIEIVKGRGVVTHVQERMATIESYLHEKPSVLSSPLPDKFARQVPFNDPEVGDIARPIFY